MSYLPEHADLQDLTDDDHPQYLPLTAGSGRSLSGDLYTSSIYMENAYPIRSRLAIGGTWYGVVQVTSSDQFRAGASAFVLEFLGSAARPTYNTAPLALYSDIGSLATRTVTSSTDTPTSLDCVILCDATSNTVTINLPTAVGITGKVYNIKAINVDNAVTVDADGTEEIDGSATAITLALMEVITIQSDGSNWWII